MSLIKRFLIPISNAFFAILDKVDALIGRSVVREVSIEQLVAQRSDETPDHAADHILVDVRSATEQAVSIIPGAITKEEFERDYESFKHKTVIAYCTAGGRSYLYARKLLQKDVNAMNLKPGIVGWCNAGQPLHTIDGDPTNRVHLNKAIFAVPADYVAVH